MSHEDEDFPTLVYQYVDFAGSPDEIGQWKTEDLQKLIAMAQAELKRRGHEFDELPLPEPRRMHDDRQREVCVFWPEEWERVRLALRRGAERE